MIEENQILAVISWLIVLMGIHLSFYPLLKDKLPKIAIPVSLTGGILTCTILSWYTVLVGLPLITGLVPVLILLVWSVIKEKKEAFAGISSGWPYYLIFFLCFFAMLAVRAYNPDINGAEKFMDHAFLASIMRDPLVPPLDPWFAGGFLNVYYYLGHWMIAFLGTVAGVPSPVLFNLALPTIASLSAVNLYGVGSLLLRRVRILPVLAFFIVNPFFVYLVLTGTDSFSLLWNSSRVIEDTINEYPLFSFLFGDVHAHVLGILLQTFLILMVTAVVTSFKTWKSTGRMVAVFFTLICLAMIPAVHSWDIFIWAPMILVTGITLFLKEFGAENLKQPVRAIHLLKQKIREEGGLLSGSPLTSSLIFLVLVPAGSLVLISPLLLGMQTQGIEGIGFVHTPSKITEFLFVHGWFFAAILISVRKEIMKIPWIIFALIPFSLTGYYSAVLTLFLFLMILRRREGVPDLLAGGGLAILLFCELFFLSDNMGETWYRMNTVFKLYIGAWLLIGTGSALMIGNIVERRLPDLQKTVRSTVMILPIILLLMCLVIPAMMVFSVHGPDTPTLDGLKWLEGEHTGDAEAIYFLRSLPGEHILVETAGIDYQYSGRVSAFTGIPTIIGWQFHEYMWRGDVPSGWYGTRANDVRAIYEEPDKTRSLMNAYNADLLYVGPLEIEQYSVSLPFDRLQILYKNQYVSIYQIKNGK